MKWNSTALRDNGGGHCGNGGCQLEFEKMITREDQENGNFDFHPLPDPLPS